jgi:hypothetical protein
MLHMTLREVIEKLNQFHDNDTIFAQRVDGGFPSTSPAAVFTISDDDLSMKTGEIASRECPGLSYMLEVSIAKEVLEAWSKQRDGRIPTTDEALHAVAHYAEYDAYLQEE